MDRRVGLVAVGRRRPPVVVRVGPHDLDVPRPARRASGGRPVGGDHLDDVRADLRGDRCEREGGRRLPGGGSVDEPGGRDRIALRVGRGDRERPRDRRRRPSPSARPGPERRAPAPGSCRRPSRPRTRRRRARPASPGARPRTCPPSGTTPTGSGPVASSKLPSPSRSHAAESIAPAAEPASCERGAFAGAVRAAGGDRRMRVRSLAGLDRGHDVVPPVVRRVQRSGGGRVRRARLVERREQARRVDVGALAVGVAAQLRLERGDLVVGAPLVAERPALVRGQPRVRTRLTNARPRSIAWSRSAALPATVLLSSSSASVVEGTTARSVATRFRASRAWTSAHSPSPAACAPW